MREAVDELVSKASRGDAAAVESLLARYLPDLVVYVDRHAARLVRERELKQDLAQSVCREVLEKLRDGRLAFRGEPEFRQWLYRAAVLKLADRARFWGAERRDAGREQPLPSASGAGAPGPATTPSQIAIHHEELARFEAAVASLPERSREVLALRLVEGLSHREMAERLGTSEANSRMLLSRALAQLAQRGVHP